MTDLLTEEMVEKACCAEHGKDWRNYYNKKDQDFLFEATRRAILAILRMMVEACAKVADAEAMKLSKEAKDARNDGDLALTYKLNTAWHRVTSVAAAIRAATKGGE